ncbi:hypothetical protein FBEOM_1177 [Fusarium beomiforme]|uniref:Uncharacterized protein n=1 Tax=Fusarium beomiforme TaxID=44412 RepID=A0A9P5E1C7_9HYPO|nr:hypothetical protein FBEOM_1177 [Fusarium beomiforme]
MLQFLLQTNCPPSIVKLFLKQVNDEDLTFNYFGGCWDLNRGLEEISDLLSILFDDMFAPWIYKGDSTRSMGDDLEAKIDLLTQYQGANRFELYMLREILAAQ